MKHLNDFKLFEAKEKVYEPKLDGAVLSRLIRGKDQGYLEDYSIDYNTNKIAVKFIKPFADQDRTFNMSIRYGQSYDNKLRQYVTSKRPIHTLSADMHDFTSLMNSTAAKFVKMNKSKGVVDEKGNVHSELDLVKLLKDTDAMKKLTDFLKLIPLAFKNGKIEFFTRNEMAKAKGIVRGFDEENWREHASPLYSVSKGGKVYLLRHPPTTLQSLPPLNSLKDYEKALEALFYHIYTKKLERWKARYAKDPSILHKIPHTYLSEIAPKLVDVTKIGIFDDDNDD